MKTLQFKATTAGISRLQLLHGQFSREEAIELITQMVHVKISFHEDKIKYNVNEEDIKMREARIKELQRDLYEIKVLLDASDKSVSLSSFIQIE